ncbi:DUF4274 domain-containing protein [Roseomonas sp. CAU 1739]|uniref:DUF4274 domain-containing protein n=1 Tax=Roseomonas sp. CAU 1739 TaxID=3140364 RepID=UPI00325BCEAC
MWLGPLLSILFSKRKAAQSSAEAARRFLDLRPPVPRSEAERLTAMSGGRMRWRSDGVQEDGFSVWLNFGPDGVARDIIFGRGFPPHLDIDGLRIGLPLPDLLRRHPTLVPGAPSAAPSARPGVPRWVPYTGAMTASGHAITIAVADNQVVAFTLGLPREAARDRDFGREWEVRQREMRESMAARRAQRRRHLGNPSTTRGDDDAMLATWAREEKAAGARIAGWLTGGASSDERHALVLGWNWDHGVEPLFWIVRREDCDVATALHVFDLAQPDDAAHYDDRLSEMPDAFEEGFWLTSEIFERWGRGFYRRSELAWTPVMGPADRVLGRDGRARPVPARMNTPIEGRHVSPDMFEDGFLPGVIRDRRS